MKLDPLSKEGFINYEKDKVHCDFVKARKLFNEDDDVVRTNKALSACKVFDIFFLHTSPSTTNIKLMIDDLSYLNFPEFTNQFLEKMKENFPSLLNLVTTYDFDFESSDSEGEKYKKRVLTRARRSSKRAIMFEVEKSMHTNTVTEYINEIHINPEEEINIID